MTKQIKTPKEKIIRKPKEIIPDPIISEPEPIIPETLILEEKQPGKVKQIENMIVSILKENPEGMTSKDIIGKCPSEFNSATWQTRIYRLRAAGTISYDKGSKLFKV